jgi:hypothetical protein
MRMAILRYSSGTSASCSIRAASPPHEPRDPSRAR